MTEELAPELQPTPVPTEAPQSAEKELVFAEVVAQTEALVKQVRQFIIAKDNLTAALIGTDLLDLKRLVDGLPPAKDSGYMEHIESLAKKADAAGLSDTKNVTKQVMAEGLKAGVNNLRSLFEFIERDDKLKQITETLDTALRDGKNINALGSIITRCIGRIALLEDKIERGEQKEVSNEQRNSLITHFKTLGLGYAELISDTQLKSDIESAMDAWMTDPREHSKVHTLLKAVKERDSASLNTLMLRAEIRAMSESCPKAEVLTKLATDLEKLAATDDSNQATSTASETASET